MIHDEPRIRELAEWVYWHMLTGDTDESIRHIESALLAAYGGGFAAGRGEDFAVAGEPEPTTFLCSCGHLYAAHLSRLSKGGCTTGPCLCEVARPSWA